MRLTLAKTLLVVAFAMAGAAAGATATAGATAAGGATASPAPTPAQIRAAIRRAERSRTLWATVNICDPRRRPNALGVRGQMPTLGFPASMSLDIRVNHYAPAKHRFEPVPHATVEVSLERPAKSLQQAGATFRFPRHAGLLNASFTFRWKRSGRLLGQATRTTTGGHRDADFGSPPHFSAAQCRIR